MPSQVVITGMGTVNALGLGVAETWEKVVQGVSGVGPITLCDTSDLPVKIAGEVKGFDATVAVEPREVRRRDRFENMASVAAAEALRAAL